MGSSLEDLRAVPDEPRVELGFSLDQVQRGQFPPNAKPLGGALRGMLGLSAGTRGESFRLVYAVTLADAVWVVHAFKKKSTQGIGIPKHELRTLLSRWRALRARHAGENQHEG